ncbi:hypothetical protein ACDF64_02115 [Agromyces sp. MMS24-JH15]|uniref:hypothetical protein n=1 Tax=Agromyces sp. MMS24-JH15 TaxID=3243765 RepID=UPI003748E9EE
MANNEQPPGFDPEGEGEDAPSSGGSWRTFAVVGVVVALIIGGLATAIALSGGGTATLPTGSNAAETSAPPATSSAPPTDAAEPTVPSVDPSPVVQPPPADPVPIDQPAEIAPALTARITSIEAVQGEAQGPGEIDAPSIRVAVEIRNDTDAASSLSTATVTGYYGSAMTPAPELREPGGTPFPASVAAGGRAEAVFIFSVPTDERDDVTIMVDYSLDYAPLQFHGAVPR